MNDSTQAGGKKPLGVYAALERNERTHWFKLGAAFTNRDGSLTVLLDAVPIGTNRLQIREQRTWEEGRPARAGGQAASQEQHGDAQLRLANPEAQAPLTGEVRP